MTNTFLTSTINFLRGSDISERPMEIRPVELEKGKQIVYSGSYASFCKTPLKNNPELSLIILFSLVDAFTDLEHPDFEGKNFKNKLEALPCTTKTEKCFKECYRVIRVLRNCCIHGQSGFTFYNKRISYCKNDNRIDISELGIDYLFTFFLQIIDNNYGNEFTEKHKEIFNVALYNQIKDSITCFSDTVPGTLAKVENCSPFNSLKWVARYYCKNSGFEKVKNNSLKINTISITDYPTDYLITYECSKLLIPSEILSGDSTIDLDRALSWKL
ncbi:hypothetical protein KGS74_06150 [Lacticaseibacillus casei]|uniref:hypothetical protein n=1 Tax=Lacticaseibacillus TaxID=2759736 RepID=UPI0006686221|nr:MULTISPECIES: hypothetical protein [Lacticaseibacillus]QVI38517.1 hypothetical protein KGS74_06150 [Lacticaseibacillus casei]WFB42614.1 hypothetical protein LHUE2_000615 [Lacticaseibacillus huelsenbergensis]